jgi:hypothetical protein
MIAPMARPPTMAPGIHQPLERASTLLGDATAARPINAAAARAIAFRLMSPPPMFASKPDIETCRDIDLYQWPGTAL